MRWFKVPHGYEWQALIVAFFIGANVGVFSAAALGGEYHWVNLVVCGILFVSWWVGEGTSRMRKQLIEQERQNRKIVDEIVRMTYQSPVDMDELLQKKIREQKDRFKVN
jgi:hypothetical protein